ncbi:MAG: SusE domain-containing protein [Tannerellaceae bacterium]|nr:SusE domain-containing protein [Tannerellaceae bacterium]
MKAILIKLTIISSFLLAFIACSEDGKVRHLDVTAVQTLYEPDNGKDVILESSASASLYFAWEAAKAEDSGMVLYEIAIDKVDGDFSNPLYREASDNNGGANSATVLHKQLNVIAEAAGIGSGQQGTLKWTVYSSKGINSKKAEEERTFTVTRPEGFADIPEQLYITGNATEVGNDLENAMSMRKVTEGEFEIYMELTAGETFRFVSGTAGEPTEYSVNGEKVVIGGTSSVSETGIYMYYVDFNSSSVTTKKVNAVKLFLCWAQKEYELPYKGLGIWEDANLTITGLEEGGDNDDDRYKFRMESSAGETEWRSPSNDSKPTGNASYYYMVEKTNVEQWTDNEVWKSPSTTGWNNKTYEVTFSLNPQSAYTHNLVIK